MWSSNEQNVTERIMGRLSPGDILKFRMLFNHIGNCKTCYPEPTTASVLKPSDIENMDDSEREDIIHKWMDNMCESGLELAKPIFRNYKPDG